MERVCVCVCDIKRKGVRGKVGVGRWRRAQRRRRSFSKIRSSTRYNKGHCFHIYFLNRGQYVCVCVCIDVSWYNVVHESNYSNYYNNNNRIFIKGIYLYIHHALLHRSTTLPIYIYIYIYIYII
jgi:hypothetical protein